MIKAFVVSKEWVDRIHAARLRRWNSLSYRAKKKCGDYMFYAVCEGCGENLKVGDQVLEFRTWRFCHKALSCVAQLSLFSVTHELRNLAKML